MSPNHDEDMTVDRSGTVPAPRSSGLRARRARSRERRRRFHRSRMVATVASLGSTLALAGVIRLVGPSGGPDGSGASAGSSDLPVLSGAPLGEELDDAPTVGSGSATPPVTGFRRPHFDPDTLSGAS